MILSDYIRTVLVEPTKRMTNTPLGPSMLCCLPQNSVLSQVGLEGPKEA